jgi:hypothetical protein
MDNRRSGGANEMPLVFGIYSLELWARANPAKVEDFCDQDLLQYVELALNFILNSIIMEWPKPPRRNPWRWALPQRLPLCTAYGARRFPCPHYRSSR